MTSSSSKITTEPEIKFSNEESKANVRARLAQNQLNLIELVNSLVDSSESSKLFRSTYKSFLSSESAYVEPTCDKLKKIQIVAEQLNCQVDAIKSSTSKLKELEDQIKLAQLRLKNVK